MDNYALSDIIRSTHADEPFDRFTHDPERESATESSRRNKRFALSILLPPLFGTTLYLVSQGAFMGGAVVWLLGLLLSLLFTFLPGMIYWGALELFYREGWLRHPFANLVAGTLLGFGAGFGVLAEMGVLRGGIEYRVEMIIVGGIIGAIVAMIIRYIAPPFGLLRGWKWNVVVNDYAGREMREAVHTVRMVARVIAMIVQGVR